MCWGEGGGSDGGGREERRNRGMNDWLLVCMV